MKSKQLQLSASDKRQLLQIIDGFSRARILGIGDFILDKFVWGNVTRISPEAPVPVVNVKRESYMPGGSVNNWANRFIKSQRALWASKR